LNCKFGIDYVCSLHCMEDFLTGHSVLLMVFFYILYLLMIVNSVLM
jgi:hypothetical protein